MEKFKKSNFIDLQLFADDGNAESSQATTNETSTDNDKNNEEQKTVSKELFDKTSSELVKVKKALKDLENKGKTEEQLKADIIAEREQKLAEVTQKLNKLNAVSILAEAKVKCGIDKNADFEIVLDSIVTDTEETTIQKATSLSKLINDVYKKGFDDAKKGDWDKMSGVSSGNGKTDSKGSIIAKQLSEEKNNKPTFVWGVNKK